jgi:hypothetical protein
VGWIHLAQDSPVAGSCEHGNKPLVSIKSQVTKSFSRRAAPSNQLLESTHDVFSFKGFQVQREVNRN